MRVRDRRAVPIKLFISHAHWKTQFSSCGALAGLKCRSALAAARDDDHRRLQAKIGELLMETELLYAKVDQLEASGPLARRRSTR